MPPVPAVRVARRLVVAVGLALAATGGAPVRAADAPAPSASPSASPSAAREPWHAPEAERKRDNPVPGDADAIAAGKQVYAERCVNCHGEQGKGDGRGSAFMPVKPSDLTREEVLAESDGELFWKITTGRRPMPDFAKRLSDKERWQVVHYLRDLAMRFGSSAPAEK